MWYSKIEKNNHKSLLLLDQVALWKWLKNKTQQIIIVKKTKQQIIIVKVNVKS